MMDNLWNFIYAILIIVIIYIIIQKYNEYCYNLKKKSDSYNEHFGVDSDSHDDFDDIHL